MLGWAHSGARTPDYSSFFGLFHVPQFTSPDKAVAQTYEDLHILFAYVLLALIVLHLAAAAFHHATASRRAWWARGRPTARAEAR
jgi:cytochrome b561